MLDAVIIGAGPAGAATAARLAARGRQVVVLEKERFPRFHIGESLLPCSAPLLEELGVTAQMNERFLVKHAAEFVTSDGSLERRYPFAEGLVDHPGSAWEVERAEFDALLVDAAEKAGAEVRQQTEVKNVEFDAQAVTVTCRGQAGEQRLSARVVVDATGQTSLLGGRRGLREMDANLKNVAVFAHYDGAQRRSGDREGDITIVLDPDGWWWLIPLRGGRTSVGFVAPKRALRGRKPDEAFLLERIESTPVLAERLKGATRVAAVNTVSDYSFTCRRFAGDRFLLVGDAAAFLDPVFSTGVHLGLRGAFAAAEAIDGALERGKFSAREFRDYEKFVDRAVSSYRGFVRGFYTPEFVELLMNPNDWLELRRAVTSLLAGAGIDRPEIAWRIGVFRTLARVNRHVELVPRISARRD